MYQQFPRTTVGGKSLSRMIIGSNWLLGWSHTSVSADDMIKRRYDSVEKFKPMLETYLKTNQRNKAALNDAAYAYALDNQPIEAQKKLDQAARYMNVEHPDESDVCLVATQGMVMFRMGDVANGTKLYENAIDVFSRGQRKDLEKSARLNYAREILRHDNNEASREKVTTLIKGIDENEINVELNELLKDVKKMLEEKNEKK